MDNIYKLQDTLKDFTQQEFNKFYEFNHWKQAVALETNNQNNSELLSLFDVFGMKVKPVYVTTRVQASRNDWDACCSVTYEWTLRAGTIHFEIMLVNGEVRSSNIKDMRDVFQTFRDDFDLAREFEKLVVVPLALSNPST